MIHAGYNAEQLLADLKAMGIRAGDILIVHASMKSIGWVEGGAATVIKALQQAVTRQGTVLMPVFSYSFEKMYSPAEAFDLRTSPSQTGLLTECFRKTRGVMRSAHPTHSVCAWGRLSKILTAGHEQLSAFAEGSPFHRAVLQGAKVCMIGCDFISLSLLHVAEEVAQVPYLGAHAGWRPAALTKDKKGKVVKRTYAAVPGCSRGFRSMQALAERKGLIRKTRLGRAKVLLFTGMDILNLASGQLRQRPDFLLCPPSTCRVCDERRSVFEAKASPAAAAVGECIMDIVRRAGIRLAGSAGEHRAAEIIMERMSAIGLKHVHIQKFPVTAWQPGFSTVQIRCNKVWEDIPSAPCAHSPATGRDGVSGRIVNVESIADIGKIREAEGSIAVLWDGYGESRSDFRRLMSRGFRGFIFVDRRFIHGELVAIGLPSQWIRHFKIPMVSISYPDAIRLFGHGATHGRIVVEGRNVRAFSANVIGEIPGRKREAVAVTAHHDSTFNTTAPDDNLCGVAAMLHIARVLIGRRPPEWTLRFCSLGAEEQLSEGARYYVLESGQAKDIRFVLNNDGIGARVGTTQICVTGPKALTAWIKRQAVRSPLPFKMIEGVFQFSDQFPFNVVGIPSVWFYRVTTSGERHYHHTVLDCLAEISFEGIARLAAFQTDLIRRLAYGDRFPFPPHLTGDVKNKVSAASKHWLRG